MHIPTRIFTNCHIGEVPMMPMLRDHLRGFDRSDAIKPIKFIEHRIVKHQGERMCRGCKGKFPSDLLLRIGGNKDNCYCKTCAPKVIEKRKAWGRE